MPADDQMSSHPEWNIGCPDWAETFEGTEGLLLPVSQGKDTGRSVGPGCKQGR